MLDTHTRNGHIPHVGQVCASNDSTRMTEHTAAYKSIPFQGTLDHQATIGKLPVRVREKLWYSTICEQLWCRSWSLACTGRGSECLIFVRAKVSSRYALRRWWQKGVVA